MGSSTTEVDYTVTSSYSNLTSNGTVAAGRDENLAKIEILIQAVIFALAVVGNSMVLLVLACRWVLNSSSTQGCIRSKAYPLLRDRNQNTYNLILE